MSTLQDHLPSLETPQEKQYRAIGILHRIQERVGYNLLGSQREIIHLINQGEIISPEKISDYNAYLESFNDVKGLIRLAYKSL